eukprot:scaffold220725_cov48-Prasinocladus_malaysianus.AAC.1
MAGSHVAENGISSFWAKSRAMACISTYDVQEKDTMIALLRMVSAGRRHLPRFDTYVGLACSSERAPITQLIPRDAFGVAVALSTISGTPRHADLSAYIR